jgi:hypothetical protein
MAYPDQAVFFVLKKHEVAMLADLRALPYSEPTVRTESIERFHRIEKGLRMEFLSRTTPELEKLLGIFRTVLSEFFTGEFRASVGEFCWEVVRESRVAQGKPFGYKLGPDAFAAFRESFDKKFLERLVLDVQEPILQRAGQDKGTFRDETLRFVADPHIFLEICNVMCDSFYDYLHGEGYLDLPSQWRAHLERQ